MNAIDFIKKIEGLYGLYNDNQRKVVLQWLEKSNINLIDLYAEILRTVSWQYKCPPGPAEFEAAKAIIYKARLEANRPELQYYKPLELDEPFVDEATAQAAFDKMREVTGKRKLDPVNEQDRRLELKAQAEYLEGME